MLANHQVNLHTHTPLCGHAVGTIRDFCTAAVQADIKVLGFSDHAPFPDNRPMGDRMDISLVAKYVSEIEEAKREFPQLKLLTGFELDYIRDMSPYAKIYKDQYHFDYLLGSAHRVPVDGKEIFFLARDLFSEKTFLKFMEANLTMMESGVVDAICHPDACAGGYTGQFTNDIASSVRQLAKRAKELNIPLEVNANGFRKGIVDTIDGPRPPYPWTRFWEIVSEEDSPVIIAADAHSPKNFLDASWQQTWDFAKEMKLRICNAEFSMRF